MVVLDMVDEETTAEARSGEAGAGRGEARAATALYLVEVTVEGIGVDGGTNSTGNIVHGLPSMIWPRVGPYPGHLHRPQGSEPAIHPDDP